jgi:hypothetical protein
MNRRSIRRDRRCGVLPARRSKVPPERSSQREDPAAVEDPAKRGGTISSDAVRRQAALTHTGDSYRRCSLPARNSLPSHKSIVIARRALFPTIAKHLVRKQSRICRFVL